MLSPGVSPVEHHGLCVSTRSVRKDFLVVVVVEGSIDLVDFNSKPPLKSLPRPSKVSPASFKPKPEPRW